MRQRGHLGLCEGVKMSWGSEANSEAKSARGETGNGRTEGEGEEAERPQDTHEEQTLQYLTSTARTNCGSYFTSLL